LFWQEGTTAQRPPHGYKAAAMPASAITRNTPLSH
jgi:hypothetical protein